MYCRFIGNLTLLSYLALAGVILHHYIYRPLRLRKIDIFQWQLKKKQSMHLALELAKASPGHLTDEQLNLPFSLKYMQLWHKF